VIHAYRLVKNASWPKLHPAMAERAATWAERSADELELELQEYLGETMQPGCGVRVFWKLLPKYLYAGANDHIAHDAGLKSSAELIGIDDFNPRVSWGQQAGLYRRDDMDVCTSRRPKLDIFERQTSASGAFWLHTGKAPIRRADGVVIGVFGMYEVLDAQTGDELARRQVLAKERRSSTDLAKP
jgi:hypothetical protein